MKGYNLDEDNDSMSEESEDGNINIISGDAQKNPSNNLISSLKSEEVKTTIFNIFDFYYESNKNSLKNIRKQKQK